MLWMRFRTILVAIVVLSASSCVAEASCITFSFASASTLPNFIGAESSRHSFRKIPFRQLQQSDGPSVDELPNEAPREEPLDSAALSEPVVVEAVPNGTVIGQLPPTNRLENILLAELSPPVRFNSSSLIITGNETTEVFFGEVDHTKNCSCSDTIPQDAFSCEEIRFAGNCENETIVEGNFCEITCDRCACCPGLMEMASRRGLDTFRKAVETLAETEGPRSVASALRNPAYRGTVFAPTNQAFGRALHLLNFTQETFFRQSRLLNQVITNHVLMGDALAFLDDLLGGQLGSSLITQNIASFLALNASESTVELQSVGSRSRIIISDIYACQSVLHIVDEVLLPFPTDGFWD